MISKELLSEVLGLTSDEKFKYTIGTIFDIGDASFKHYSKHYNYSKFLECEDDSYLTMTIHGKNDINGSYYTFNIHELAHKCKAWAFKNGYELETTYSGDIRISEYSTSTIVKSQLGFNEVTEAEATFLATQWILDNKEIK